MIRLARSLVAIALFGVVGCGGAGNRSTPAGEAPPAAPAATAIPTASPGAQAAQAPIRPPQPDGPPQPEADDAYRRARALFAMYVPAPPDVPGGFQAFQLREGISLAESPAVFDVFTLKPTQAALQARIRALRDVPPVPAIRPIPAATAATSPVGAKPTGWVNIGPTNVAGRVTSIDFDPTTPKTIYRGTGGGGVWRSDDAGATWVAKTDHLGSLSIGAVAVAPSNPVVVYAGTGEGSTAIDAITGIGVIVSSDRGEHWTLRTADETKAPTPAMFFDISVNPKNADEALTGSDLGIQLTPDRGQTWTAPLTGVAVTRIVRSPADPQVVLAGGWNLNGARAEGTIHKSTNGGKTWNKVGGSDVKGFKKDLGRMSLAFAPSKPKVVYAFASSSTKNALNCNNENKLDQIGLFKSTDAGEHWDFVGNYFKGNCQLTFTSILGGQGWYSNTLIVDPKDDQRLWAGGIDLWRSDNGGTDWQKESDWRFPNAAEYVHSDIHALVWVGQQLLVATDGGLHRRDAPGKFTGLNAECQTAQYYSIGLHPNRPDLLIGGSQDNGVHVRKPATTEYLDAQCEGSGCGDGFDVAINPQDSKGLYITSYHGKIFKQSAGLDYARAMPSYDPQLEPSPPFFTRLVASADAAGTLLTGTRFVWVTTDGGQTWSNRAHDFSDGTELGYISAVAVADKGATVIVGTASGHIWKSDKGGQSDWYELTGFTRHFVTNIEIDKGDSRRFFVTFGNTGPFRAVGSMNGGNLMRTDRGLPDVPIHVIRIDPRNGQTLYAGSDRGLYVSTDNGNTWTRDLGLPAVSVWDVQIMPDGSLIRVATHGRGFFERRLGAGGVGTP